MVNDLEQLEIKIKKNENLEVIGKKLELILNGNREPEQRSSYLYLYAQVLHKKQLDDQAVIALTEAVQGEDPAGPALLFLAKLYRLKKNYSKALNCLQQCIDQDYQVKYCSKLQIKYAYLAKDYVAVNNGLLNLPQCLGSRRLALILRVECLLRLQLNEAAGNEYRKLATERFSNKLKIGLEDLWSGVDSNLTDYETCYRKNLEYFQTLGYHCKTYADVQYKACRFVNTELVYDGVSGLFVAVIDNVLPDKELFKIVSDDVIMIANPDNSQIFKHLLKIYNQVDSRVYHKNTSKIPVFVMEGNLQKWELLMQFFDFNSLSEWQNIHFILGKTESEIREIFSEDMVPFPNLFYGNGLDDLKNMLLEVKSKKDERYSKWMEELKLFYQNCQHGTVEKVLVVTSLLNDSLLYYGRLLYNYLLNLGYNCRLHTESELYYKFVQYHDIRMLNDFRPDLVIHLFAERNEEAIFNQIGLPFASWFIFQKHLSSVGQQSILISGNQVLETNRNEKADGLQTTYVPLPAPLVRSVPSSSTGQKINSNDLGVIADLGNIEIILKNLTDTLFYRIITKQMVTPEALDTVIKGIYFDIYAKLSKDFKKIEITGYQEIISKHFTNQDLRFDQTSLAFISELFKRELENQILKLIQVSWIMNSMKGHSLGLYGEGWGHDPELKDFHEGEIDFFNDLPNYHQLVGNNKLNIYIGNRIQNESYLQPDLINGIAAGGFFLVNGLLVKEYGAAIVEPFGGLLETYHGQAEMVQKMKYYLEHEPERISKAKQLQEYVNRHFTIEKVAAEILNGVKNGLIENLN